MMGNYHVQFGKGGSVLQYNPIRWIQKRLAYPVHIRMELSGPGVQYIAGAPFYVRFKSGDLDPISCCQYLLNLLTYLITKEVRECSMSVNPYLSIAKRFDESGEVDAFYVLNLLTMVGLCVSIGISLA